MRKIEEIRKASLKEKENKNRGSQRREQSRIGKCNTNLKVGILKGQDDDDVIQTEDVIN